ERGVEQTIPDKIPQHKRDITLTRIAGYFRYRGMVAEEILQALKEINKQRCKPPIKEEQLIKIANSVAKYDPSRTLVDGTVNDAELVMAEAAEGKDKPITWRWPLFLPRGKLIGWGGDPGQGKSTMAYTIAAALSSGKRLPGDEGLEE